MFLPGVVVLSSDITVATAQLLLQSYSDHARVALRVVLGPKTFWYLLTVGEVQSRAQESLSGKTLEELFNFAELEPAEITQWADGGPISGGVPRLVLDGDRVVGIVEASPVSETRREEFEEDGVEWAGRSDIGFRDFAERGPSDPELMMVDGGDIAPGSDPLIRRTPHLDAPDQLPTAPGSTFKVRVWTDQAPARTGEESENVVVEAPPDVRMIDLGVLLVTSPHLAADGAYFQSLTIDRETPDSEPIEFAVTVRESHSPGPVTLIAQFLYRGRPCGRVRRLWTWPAGEALPAEASTTGVPVHTEVEDPDLSVVITATGAGRFSCSVRARELSGGAYTDPLEWEGVRDSAAELVSRELAKLVDRTQSEGKRRLALQTAGRTFWKAAPKPFQDALWELIDARVARRASRRAAIYIASDEPLLPWEIMRPSRPRPGEPDEDRPQPLGVEFAVGRWVRGDATSPPQTLPVRDSFLIAATYVKADDALDPTTEREVLEQHFAGRKLEKATYQYLDEYLRNNAASLLHFVCHGGAQGNDTTIYLDGWESCTSAELRENKGMVAACATRRPIIFLNACEAGRGNLALGPGGAGFPAAFSEMGARAIIAPLWPVTKSSAPLVAKKIYETAAADPQRPLADILAELRARSYDEGPFDDSWAAYCLFGDPRAKLQRG